MKKRALWCVCFVVVICILISLFGMIGFLKGRTISEQKMEKREVNAVVKESNEYVRMFPGVTREMLSPTFWIQKQNGIQARLMEAQEIKALNQKIIDEGEMVNLLDFSEVVDCFFLLTKIDLDSVQSTPWYVSGQLVSDKASYLDNMNLAGIPKEIPVQYGICTLETSLKGVPTEIIISGSSEDTQMDQFQYTTLMLSQPLIILHESLDQQWYFVGSSGGFGWCKKENVGLCSEKSQWVSEYEWYENVEDTKILVTGDKISFPIWESMEDSRASEKEITLSMGTTLRVIPLETLPEMIGERYYYDNYAVRVPMRNQEGMLFYGYGLVPLSEAVHPGYLPYTIENILIQCFRPLGNGYGWGGMFGERDCSSYVSAVYSCFGFHLPKNSRLQSLLPVKTIDMQGKSQEEKQRLLDALPSGTILYFPGHVTIYLGQWNGGYYSIGAVGMVGVEGQPVETVQTLMVNELTTAVRKNGKNWVEALESGMIIQ